MTGRFSGRCGPRAAIALTLALLGLVFAAPAAHAEPDLLDLERLTVGAAELSAPPTQFDRANSTPIDLAAATGGDREVRTKADDRLTEKIRQGRSTFFTARSGSARAEVRLYEFTNHHWAESFRTASTMPIPSGFPPDTRMSSLTRDGDARTVVATAVRGRVQALVYLTGTDDATTEQVLRSAVTAQIAALPDTPDLEGSTATDLSDLRVLLIGLQIAVVPVVALFLAVNSTLRDHGTLERFLPRRDSTPRARVPAVVELADVTPYASARRRTVRRHSIMTGIIATVLAGATTYLQLLLKWPALVDLALFPLAMAVAAAAQQVLATRRNTRTAVPITSQPVLLATAGWIGAMAVVYVAAYFILAAIAMIVLVDSLAIRFIALVCCVVAYRALRYVGIPFRLTRQLVMPDVEQALARDQRRQIVLLRSFQDDELLIRRHRADNYNAAELATTEPFDRFEQLLVWSLWRSGPVVAIGQPGTQNHLQPLGAAREFHSDDDWQAAARAHLETSSMIVFVVGRSPGLVWEIQNAMRLGLLGKCLFVIPPVASSEAKLRLRVLADALGLAPAALPYVVDGRFTLGVFFDAAGRLAVVQTDGRDDLAYQALLDELAEPIIQAGRRSISLDPSVRSSEPPDGSALVTFDPNVSYAFMPTAMFGLRYIVAAMRGA